MWDTAGKRITGDDAELKFKASTSLCARLVVYEGMGWTYARRGHAPHVIQLANEAGEASRYPSTTSIDAHIVFGLPEIVVPSVIRLLWLD